MGIVIYDSFTDVDGTLLENHVPEVGGKWRKVSTGTAKIASNMAVWNAGIVAVYDILTPMLGPEYDISCAVDAIADDSAATFHLYGRFEVFSNTWYEFSYDGTLQTWNIYRRVNGVNTLLATVVQALGTDQRRITISIRDAKKAIFLDGVELLTTVDNTIPDAYYVAFRLDNLTTVALDDFTVVSASELLYPVELSQSLNVLPPRVASY